MHSLIACEVLPENPWVKEKMLAKTWGVRPDPHTLAGRLAHDGKLGWVGTTRVQGSRGGAGFEIAGLCLRS